MDESTPQAQPRPFVLVVDDQNQVRALMARVLRYAGHVVMEAEDGLEALGIIESYAGALHLVVTDVTMPRVSGTELAAQIKQRWPRIPILYVSGRELPQGAPDAPRLNKPFLPDDLTAQVRLLLAQTH